jgi:hypothetical protein
MADIDVEEKGETFGDRLKRYIDRPIIDTLGWMKMYLQNQPAVELRRAREAKLYFCVYLLAHAIIQTVSELMFALTGLAGDLPPFSLPIVIRNSSVGSYGQPLFA